MDEQGGEVACESVARFIIILFVGGAPRRCGRARKPGDILKERDFCPTVPGQFRRVCAGTLLVFGNAIPELAPKYAFILVNPPNFFPGRPPVIRQSLKDNHHARSVGFCSLNMSDR